MNKPPRCIECQIERGECLSCIRARLARETLEALMQLGIIEGVGDAERRTSGFVGDQHNQ